MFWTIDHGFQVLHIRHDDRFHCVLYLLRPPARILLLLCQLPLPKVPSDDLYLHDGTCNYSPLLFYYLLFPNAALAPGILFRAMLFAIACVLECCPFCRSCIFKFVSRSMERVTALFLGKSSMKNSLPVHHATPSILLNILCGAIVLPNFSHEGILRQRRAKKYNPCISCLAKVATTVM